MKKFFLSAFVVITFIAYAWHQKITGSDQAAPITPVVNSGTSQTFSSLATPSVTDTPTTAPPLTGAHATIPVITHTPAPTPTPARSGYKDGQFTGNSADAYYGNIQVKVTISGGKITDVIFLNYPQDRRTSVMINSQAMPFLKQEAIQAQSAQVDIVSGATDSSLAFRQSLQSALNQAR